MNDVFGRDGDLFLHWMVSVPPLSVIAKSIGLMFFLNNLRLQKSSEEGEEQTIRINLGCIVVILHQSSHQDLDSSLF